MLINVYFLSFGGFQHKKSGCVGAKRGRGANNLMTTKEGAIDRGRSTRTVHSRSKTATAKEKPPHLQPKGPHFGTQFPQHGGELLAEGGASRRVAQIQEVEGGSGDAKAEEPLGGVYRRLPLFAVRLVLRQQQQQQQPPHAKIKGKRGWE